MVDMKYENIIVNHDSDQKEECVDDPIEPREPTTCCRCGQSFRVDEHVFDCDGCPHSTCLGCRFTDSQCILREPPSETSGNSTKVETPSGSLKELHSMYFKRRIVNKDHIVDVELATEEGSVQKQMCTICKRVFKKSNARYHYMCATGEKPHECVECGQKFVKKSHLESHLNNHYGVRPFKCSERKCKASFTQKDKLIRHMKSHNKETKLMCPLCDKMYTSQDILNHHMIKVHSSTKQFRCDQCPRTYKYPSSLRIHRLKHQAKRDYMCEVCGKRYSLSTQLMLHKRSHLVYHRRPCKCRCGKRFTSRRDNARHLLIHTSCHDFECSLCNTTFGRKDNLERHMKNFHQDGPSVLTKNRSLVATVAPFNIKPAVLKKEVSDLVKRAAVKTKKNEIGKEKVIRKDTPKAKSKHNVTKKVNISECNLKKSEKVCRGKLYHSAINLPLNITDTPTSNVCNKEPDQKQSVIVSPQQSTPQNRSSVIKTIPHLLPYRILPPDKRFLKLNGELSKRIDHSQTQTPSSMKINHLYAETSTSQNQINSLPIYENSEKAIHAMSREVENPTKPENVRRRVAKDDPLNRCFRIIHHTDAVRADRADQACAEEVPAENANTLKGNYGPAMRPFDGKINTFRSRRQQTRFSSTAASTLSVYANNRLNQEIRHNPSNTSSARSAELTNNTTDSGIGGPSLPASLSDSVLEVNHQDNFTSSYASMGEATYSSSSYTPYFDSDYFRDSINSYDSNVENLLPNDLDIGFQYINEQLGYSEMNVSSESRIIRYVSQETRIVRET